jgi:hypothetical protein
MAGRVVGDWAPCVATAAAPAACLAVVGVGTVYAAKAIWNSAPFSGINIRAERKSAHVGSIVTGVAMTVVNMVGNGLLLKKMSHVVGDKVEKYVEEARQAVEAEERYEDRDVYMNV